ncbi:MAG: AmmeMemoRadiSam system protein B [Polyangiaceae bacterium]
MSVRPAAVAGTFYPADPDELASQIEGYLGAIDATDATPPKAIIAPHAGTVYSGPIAASAYARVAAARDRITRVVLLGPAHRVFVSGLALPSVSRFRTPLGEIPLDEEGVAEVSALPNVTVNDDAHALEHSLEVHLPFLQRVLGTFSLLPLVVGRASPETVARVLDATWGGDETLIVVSSDLSHFHDYETARRIDRETSSAIERLDHGALDGERACGTHPVSGLLKTVARRGMAVRCIDLRNSGDTAGRKDRVVGYGSYVVH